MGPSFERVIGKASAAEKEKILLAGRELFDDQKFADLLDREREKTQEELEMILLANEETNKIRKKYGLNDFDIPPKNIHVIRQEALLKDETRANLRSVKQAMTIQEQSAKSVFMEAIFHEMLHFKSYTAMQTLREKELGIDEYRLGLGVNTRDGRRGYFLNLNEAVTEELTKKYVKELFDSLPLFKEEMEQTKEIVAQYPEATTEDGEPLFNDDTFYARIEGEKIFTERYTYKKAREILNLLINKLFESNKDKFQNKEEIFEVFASGMMTGNLLPVGRLVDGTFGRGTLRKIGELDQDIKAQKEFVNSL